MTLDQVGFTSWNWHTNEPNDGGAGISENCMEKYSNGLWNDYSCRVKRFFICQLRDFLHPVDGFNPVQNDRK